MFKLKKIWLFAVLLVFLAVSPVYAFEPSHSSGEQAADAGIRTGECYISSVVIITDGTNNAKLILYDNIAASGTVMLEMTVVGVDHYGGRNWAFPVRCGTGIYADITGTGASYIVEYMVK